MEVDHSQHAAIEIRLQSDPRFLCGIRELISGVARRLGFSDLEANHVALAVDEALANVIRHGYDNATCRPIWVRVWELESGGIRITLEDEARQVDPTCIKSRDLEDVRPGGLGVHIIQEIMDEVRYEARETIGMRLTMEKQPASSATMAPTQKDSPHA
ncbi:MAG: ATP-binding protein [Planctomycetota bacterium]|jgi:anti-sigma regulatory factor (Ser/Thr protein kinase)